MRILIYISNLMIPFTVFYFVTMGIIKKRNVYYDFIEGAKDGIKTVFTVMPTLIGLMIGVSVLQTSGFMDYLVSIIGEFTDKAGLPGAGMPAVIVRMFSSSAATGLVLDIFKNYGADSYLGILSAIMMSSTETIFYTMSVYFMVVKVKETRWTLGGAMISTIAGIAASVLLANILT